MHVPIDYPTLRVIWWVLLGLLLIGFAVMDGFDLGINMMLQVVAPKEDERRIVLNTIGPVWEGNQIWLILGAGAIFAAWPDIYAVSFSSFYFAMLLALLALILRPVAFKYRSKLSNKVWRSFWDNCLFISGFVPALIFGVAVGNVLQGIPFHYDEMLRSFYTGTFLDLLNPFALLCGFVSVCMLLMHGGIFLALKTEGAIQKRAIKVSAVFGVLTLILFASAGYCITYCIQEYAITSGIVTDAASNPLHKTVISTTGAWLTNYAEYTYAILIPASVFVTTILAIGLVAKHYCKLAWMMSALSVACIITTVGVSMFPFILPSSTDPSMSLTVWDASSSQMTLFIMLFATTIFLPLIVLYTSWVYYIMRGKVTKKFITQNEHSVY
jgi:cytochrome d ubiquinol oxidase subunit II